MAALAHGLPSLLLPLGADQPHNARCAGELGVAVTLEAATAKPEHIRESARAVLADDAMRERASPSATSYRHCPVYRPA